ncbi:MAG: DUF111 family protein, partial [Methanobacterium sp.]|nr:DUF111 family protein [Methanobacterium sp.]
MVVIIDPQQAGISGNMILGALISLGADIEAVVDVMDYYGSFFGQVTVNIELVNKSGISATFADIKCSDHQPISYLHLMETLNEIEHEKITPPILDFAKKVFQTLGIAESHVHGVGIDKIHFHEVGAADAVA